MLNFWIINTLKSRILIFSFLAFLLSDNIMAADWAKLENCRFISNRINDGDSFMVKHKSTTYVLRSYWIDTPEKINDYPERLAEQAAYFGIHQDEVVQIGREAKLFTQEFLRGDLTVFTQWENGQGIGQRFYGIISSEKGNLIETLVANGLASISGYSKAWPEEPSISTFRQRLLKLESQAKEKRLGAWRESIKVWDPLEYKKQLAAVPDLDGKLNINNATKEELVLLPGIGSVYSQRIIEARPFNSVEDLIKIKGIGPKTLERIKNRVTVIDEL
ncbi:MAG: helix-hairpin-helix domain-containing protein [Verrucomicrobia bacterium]|nr:helix-hairpin-helix domain-containing protein [Verrucomicrobiota bacterium]